MYWGEEVGKEEEDEEYKVSGANDLNPNKIAN